MSYLVLARKWRPQTFDEIRGQDHIVRALTNAIASGRVAHSYVFTGIRGVGKTSAARVLAKALNCATGPSPVPCNRCDECREITEGKHPDVLEIDGASNTGVEDVRRLREAVRYPPVRAKYRVYIIDEVHMLSTAAFNALLKTLEEPPPQVVFIFATTDAHKIPLTILSRCQQFDFKRLSPRELVRLIRDIAERESISIDEKSLLALAQEADGSVRDAQSLLDQVISYSGQTVRYEDVRDVLGVVDRDLLLGIARAVVARDARGVLGRLAEAERFGYDVRRFAGDLQDLFRDFAVLKTVDAEEILDLAPEEAAEARQFLSGVSWEEAHALFDMLSRGVELLRNAPRPGVVLEMTLLKMACLPPLLPLSQLLCAAGKLVSSREELSRSGTGGTLGAVVDPPKARESSRRAVDAERSARAGEAGKDAAERAQESAASGVASGTQPAPADSGQSPPSSPPLGPPEIWNRLLDSMERENRPLWNVLKAHGSLVSWDPGQRLAVLTYDDESDGFFMRSKLPLISSGLGGVLGKGVRVELHWAGRGGENRSAATDTDRARSLKREVLEHPLVREALDIFQADVEEVRTLKS